MQAVVVMADDTLKKPRKWNVTSVGVARRGRLEAQTEAMEVRESISRSDVSD